MGVLTLVHILISFAACAEAIRRTDFPPGFVFGHLLAICNLQKLKSLMHFPVPLMSLSII
uniref:Uncharacterized protein n=1 Tax=Arundo donax TaxID=35708 RepID=A0A0A9A9J7_ARUDO